MTNGTTNPLLTNTQQTSAGASFLSVLTTTVGSAVQGIAQQDPRSKDENHSWAANSRQQEQEIPKSSAAQQQASPAPADTLSGLVVTNLTTLPVNRFHAVLSTRDSAIQSGPIPNAKDAKAETGTAPSNSTSAIDTTATAPVPVVPAAVVAVPPANNNGKSATADPVAAISEGAQPPVVEARPGQNAPQQPAVVAAPVAEKSAPAPAESTVSPAKIQVSTDIEAASAAKTDPAVRNADAVAPAAPTTGPGNTATIQTPKTTAGSPIPALGSSPVTPLAHEAADAQKVVPISTGSAPAVDQPQAATPQPVASVTSPATKTDQPGAVPSDKTTSRPAPVISAATAPAASATATPVAPRNYDVRDPRLVFAAGLTPVAVPLPTTGVNTGKGTANDATPAPSGTSNPGAQSSGSISGQNATGKATPATGALPVANLVLPGPGFLNHIGDASQSVGKPADSRVSNADGVKDSNSTNATSAAKTTPASNAASSSDAAAQNAQGNTAPQHAQTDASQNTAAAAKGADATMPLQAAPVHVAAQQPIAGGVTERQPAAATPTPTPAASGEGNDVAASSGINTAKLIQAMSETQMHVGMRSAEFGDISIRTAVSQQQMVAQISVDHGDLGRAIAMHAPAAQTKLGDDLGLHAAIEVTQNGANFSNQGGGNASQQDSRSFMRPAEAVGAVGSTTETERLTPRAAVWAEDSDRLDIQA